MEARRLFQRSPDVIGDSSLPEQEREEYVRFAYDSLAEMAEEDLARLGVYKHVSGPDLRLRRSDPAIPSLIPPPRQARKIGRNDPCPCGSSRKYKKCCGR
jgi:hypothetical protein